MRRNYPIFVCGGVVILTAALAIAGCGDLEVGEVEVKSLNLVGRYPQTGEEVSAQDLIVIAVFSETVGFEPGATTDVNETTFYLEDDSQQGVTGTVEASPPDPKNTALLTLSDASQLGSGEKYWVVLEPTIQGTDSNGNATEPLGVKIRSYFIVE